MRVRHQRRRPYGNRNSARFLCVRMLLQPKPAAKPGQDGICWCSFCSFFAGCQFCAVVVVMLWRSVVCSVRTCMLYQMVECVRARAARRQKCVYAHTCDKCASVARNRSESIKNGAVDHHQLQPAFGERRTAIGVCMTLGAAGPY